MQDEGLWRLGFFLSTLLLILSWESLRPAAAQERSRWPHHLALSLLNTLLLRLLFPASALGFASLAAEQGWGLFTAAAHQLPPIISIGLSIVLLDLALYAQHRALHRWPLLWRLHRVHHGDRHLDASTALRFHPVEMTLSMAWKSVVIIALGAPLEAVLIFEILLSSCALFNHGNVRLPYVIEQPLRLLLITPSLHHIHHRQLRQHCDSNYGFCLSCWDRLFASFSEQAPPGPLGQADISTADSQRLDKLLAEPFIKR